MRFPENAIISEAAKNLISQILVLDPSKRPTLDQILTHDFFNQGTSIPKLLPPSTLACCPSLSYIQQFMPEAGKDGIINKPVNSTKLIDKQAGNNNPGNNENNELKISNEIRIKEIEEYKNEINKLKAENQRLTNDLEKANKIILKPAKSTKNCNSKYIQ